MTLPMVILGCYWGWQTIDRFWTFAVRYNPAPWPTDMRNYGQTEFRQLARQVYLGVTELTRNDTTLETLHLYISEANISELNARLPQSGFKYVKGRLLMDGRLTKAKIKYRGSFQPHWRFEKKSIRVKTSKGRLYKGIRSFNLQAPKFTEQLNNYLAYRLANVLGLVSPISELVRVFINGKDRGVHLLTEQISESTLRRNDWMPADLYRGEILGNKDAFKGSNVNDLFSSHGVWDKVAINNHYDQDSRAPIRKLIELVQARKSEAAQTAFSDMMDMDAWARFSAFETLAQTFHYDSSHNWRIYYDPWKQKFLPVVWDPVGWIEDYLPRSATAPTLSIIMSQLHEALFLNGNFLRARQRVLDEFFASSKPREFLDLVAKTRNTIKFEIQSDPGLRPTDPTLVEKSMESFEAAIRMTFRTLKSAGKEAQVPAIFAEINSGLRLSVGGNQPVWRLKLRYNKGIKNTPAAHVRHMAHSGLKETDVSGGVTVSGNDIIAEVGLLPNFQIIKHPKFKEDRGKTLLSSPGTYEVVFGELPGEPGLVSVWADQGNGWERLKRATPTEIGHQQRFHPMFAAVAEHPMVQQQTWTGKVLITGTHIIDHPLVIAAGTEVRLAAGAALIIRGRMTAKGRSDAPIRFLPENPGHAPWGTVALLGEGANGSLLTHCEMFGGSGVKGKLFEYSSMFSIHNVQDIKVSDCIFRDNKFVDDMVHVVYSSVSFHRSLFRNSFADALDLDISEVTITDSVFENSGNDAVDLMTTRARIVGTRLQGSGDKGVSVGEDSRLIAKDNVVTRNKIGIQSKDASIAVLFSQTFSGNGKALDAFKKNWQYGGGGRIAVSKSQFLENDKPITLDKHSSIQIFDSFMDDPQKRSNNFLLDFVDSDKRGKSQFPNSFYPKIWAMNNEVKEILESLSQDPIFSRNSKYRGARLND